MKRPHRIMLLATSLAIATVSLAELAPVDGGQLAAAKFSSTAYLAGYLPGAKPEATPDTLGKSFSWAEGATTNGPTAPKDSQYISLWGQLYVSTANTHPANVRVEVADCQVWALPNGSSTWKAIIDNDTPNTYTGTGWKEDWSQNNGPFDMTLVKDKQFPAGIESFATTSGWIAHFWPTPQAKTGNIVRIGSAYRAFVTACSTRLISTGTPNNTAKSSYLLSIGSDFKSSTAGGCPPDGQNGNPKCESVGVGRFIAVKTYWRRAVMTTMTKAQLASFPALPTVALRNPDGTQGSGN